MVGLAFLIFSYLGGQSIHKLVDRRVHFLRRSFSLNPSPLHRTHNLRMVLKFVHTQNYFQVGQLHVVPHKPLEPTFYMLSKRRRNYEVTSGNFYRHVSFQAEQPQPFCYSTMIVRSTHLQH
jgi:hypothetical protein